MAHLVSGRSTAGASCPQDQSLSHRCFVLRFLFRLSKVEYQPLPSSVPRPAAFGEVCAVLRSATWLGVCERGSFRWFAFDFQLSTVNLFLPNSPLRDLIAVKLYADALRPDFGVHLRHPHYVPGASPFRF